MARWIAFDDETAEAVVGRFKRGAAEIHAGEPLTAALSQSTESVVVLPSPTPGKVLLAHIEPRTETVVMTPKTSQEEMGSEPVGFLGLSDQPVFTRPSPAPAPAKKKWWQRRTA
ncbi:MAG TPA: hypothetical protein VFA68_20870 [Terriglobales bacterium]|nr:hypothetical protein [Terriglobales bacterium]